MPGWMVKRDHSSDVKCLFAKLCHLDFWIIKFHVIAEEDQDLFFPFVWFYIYVIRSR